MFRYRDVGEEKLGERERGDKARSVLISEKKELCPRVFSPLSLLFVPQIYGKEIKTRSKRLGIGRKFFFDRFDLVLLFLFI